MGGNVSAQEATPLEQVLFESDYYNPSSTLTSAAVPNSVTDVVDPPYVPEAPLGPLEGGTPPSLIPGATGRGVFINNQLFNGADIYSIGGVDYTNIPGQGVFKYAGSEWVKVPSEQVLHIPESSSAVVAKDSPGIVSQIFGGQAFGGGYLGALTSGLVWGAMVYGASSGRSA